MTDDSKKSKVSQHEMDQLERVERVTASLEKMLGDREAAVAWLHTPVPALDGQTPLSLLDSEEGARLVEETLFRSLAGVYA